MVKKVALLGFHLESNAFSPTTTEADYRKRCYVEGDDILAELAKPSSRLPAEVKGFVDDMNGSGADWRPVPILIADAEPGGPVDQAFFDRTLVAMRKRLEAAGKLDGVYIDSHGAMRATGDIDPDGTLYAMVREVVGPDVPVIATLDLHANVSARMVELTDVLVAYLTNPHVDQRERGAESAGIMRRLWAGEKAHASFVKVPIAAPTVTLLTAAGPYADLIDYGQTKIGGAILNVSITAGFIYSDSAKCGMSVIVTSVGDAKPGKALADDIANRAWKDRGRFRKDLTAIDDVVAMAVMAGRDPALPPRIVADVADNPGGGGTGNTTYLLRALVDAKADGVVLGLMIDPAVAAKAHEVGVGGTFEATFNATSEVQFDTPYTVPVTVEKLTDGKFVGRRGLLAGRAIELGPTALLLAGGVRVGVASHRKQCADPMMLEQFGIDIAKVRTVVVKSRGHFRAGFDEFFPPERVVEADCPGLTSPVLKNFPWDGLCRPVYPLDEDAVWNGPSA